MKKMLARYPLGNPRRKWKQDNFIISLFEPGPMGLDKAGPHQCEIARNGVQTAVDAGFNFSEFLWSSPEVGREMLRTAERLQYPIAFQDLNRLGGMGPRGDKNIPAEENDLEGVLRDIAPWRSACAVVLYDEPKTDDQLALARKLVDRMEELCPEKLPYVCSDTVSIDAVADKVDPPFLAFDQYPYGGAGARGITPETRMDGWVRYWNFMETAFRAAKRIEVPFWFIYQGHELDYHAEFDPYTFTCSRMMATSALLYGVKGVSCYIECDGVLDPETGKHGIYFDEQKKLNRELHMLGNTMMALECQRVIHDTSLSSHPDSINRLTMADSELVSGVLPLDVSIAELKDAYGNDYLVVANRNCQKAVRYKFTAKKPMRAWRVSDEDGKQYLAFDDERNNIINILQPGCAVLYRLQPKDEEPYAVEYYLEKGAH